MSWSLRKKRRLGERDREIFGENSGREGDEAGRVEVGICYNITSNSHSTDLFK